MPALSMRELYVLGMVQPRRHRWAAHLGRYVLIQERPRRAGRLVHPSTLPQEPDFRRPGEERHR
jgi:hypothetical protein